MIKTQPNRIDMLIHELNYSGISNAATTLVNAIAERGMPIRLIVVGEEAPMPFPINKNIEIKFFGIKRGNNFFNKVLYLVRVYFILSVYLAKERSHNLFVWGKEFTALAVIFRMSLPLKFKLVGVNVTNISSHLNNKHPIIRMTLNRIYKSLLPNPEHIIAQSGAMVEELINIYNIPLDKITVIPPPLQSKFFNIHQEKTKTGKILFIGKLTDSKDPLAALEIFKKICDLRKNSTKAEKIEPTLIFIGEGELEYTLREKIAELELEKQVSLIGKQNDILPFLRDADALIMTSKYEGFCMVLAESIACGVPVISFDCPTGPSEIIIDGVNGYLIPPKDINLFAQKLDLLLTKNLNQQRISQTANKFHHDVVIKDYIEIIKKYF